MKRLLLLSFILWLSLLSYKSYAASYTFETYSQAYSACVSKANEYEANPVNKDYSYYCNVDGLPNETYQGQPGYLTLFAENITNGVISRSDRYYWTDLGEPTPPCESPNYIDVVSGECVPPQEICFTTIESMATECVYIGEDDPADQVPEGCVVDVNTGAQICLSDQPGCYVADGKTICPTPDMICGTKNGTFSCVAPEQEGCGYFNGERVCFTPDGQKVDPNSPDHPDNGGNLDGDDGNDPTDPRTPEQGGNPDNQPIDTTGQGDGATEGTAREQLKTLRDLRDQIKAQGKANEGNGSQIESAIASDIDSSGDAAAGVLDGHITDIDSPGPIEGDDLSAIGGAVTGIFGAPAQCQDIVFGVDKLSYTITCADGEKIRDLLGFLLYVFTIIRLFNVATRPAAAGTS